MVFQKGDKGKEKQEDKAGEKKEAKPKEEEKKAAPKEEKKEAKEETKAKDKKEAKAKEKEPPQEEAKDVPAKAPAKEEVKKEVEIEAFYSENKLKNGEVFLKRRKGKPRFRKIVSKSHQAQLYFRFQGKWIQKTALPKKGIMQNYRWHLRNKWEKVDQAQAEK